MKHNIKAILLGVVVVVAITGLWLFLHNGDASAGTSLSKADTARTWIRYFNHKAPNEAHDTATYALRIIKDSVHEVRDTGSKGHVVITKVSQPDTLYFVPYDTVVKVPLHIDSVNKVPDSLWHGRARVKVFVPLPEGWLLTDYNKVTKMGTKVLN